MVRSHISFDPVPRGKRSPFRGDNEDLNLEGWVSGGLFLNTLQLLVFQLQPELANIFKTLPRNAKYLTSDIQNEFIEILANMVQEKHAATIRKGELYTIMADGTTDKNNEEIQGIVIRFFNSDLGKIEERTLNVSKSGRSAKEIFEFLHSTLEKTNISFVVMVWQAFDGASLMSGARGGLQALVSCFCGRSVIYIHSQNSFSGDLCDGKCSRNKRTS